jgi:hypothetical protein
MSAERDFAFLIRHRAMKANIYIIADNGDSQRISKLSEQYASYDVSNGKLTIIHDEYDAIAQPKIYDALMKAVKNSEADSDDLHVIMDGGLSDYMNGQLEA